MLPLRVPVRAGCQADVDGAVCAGVQRGPAAAIVGVG